MVDGRTASDTRSRARGLSPLLGLSAVLHGLVLGLWMAFRAAPPPPLPRPIPIEMVWLPPEGAQPARAPSPQGPPLRSAVRAPPSAKSVEPPAVAAPTAPVPGSADWLRANGLESEVQQSGTLTLGVRPGAGRRDGGPTPHTTPSGGEPTAKGLVDGWLRDAKAEAAAVQSPDSYWSRVRELLERGFAPGWEILEGTKQDLGALAWGTVRRALAAQPESAGSGGSVDPFDSAPGRIDARPSSEVDVRPRPTAAEQRAARGDATLFHRELVILIRIAQDADGRVSRVELAQTSGVRAYDRLALARAQALSKEAEPGLGPPPPQGRETLWAFATRFEMVPPAPALGCSFDPQLMKAECYYPTKKMAKADVQLRSVR